MSKKSQVDPADAVASSDPASVIVTTDTNVEDLTVG